MSRFACLLLVLALAASGLAATESGTTWGYSGAIGPAFWGDLNPAYSACKLGKIQSPIDFKRGHLRTSAMPQVTLPALRAANVTDGAYTLLWEPSDGASRGMNVNGTLFGLLQFHAHAPSEHRINGRYYPAEVHLVHKSQAGKLAVLGFFLDEDTKDTKPSAGWEALLKPMLAGHDESEHDMTTDPLLALPAPSDTHVAVPLKVKDELASDAVATVQRALASPRGHFHYMGSLTTPPCTEGVAWYVAREPIYVSGKLLKLLACNTGYSARPPQPNVDADMRLGGAAPRASSSPAAAAKEVADEPSASVTVATSSSVPLSLIGAGVGGSVLVAAAAVVAIQRKRALRQDAQEPFAA